MCGGRVEVSAPLQTGVGVATEFVVIGDLIGSGEAQEDGIVGETPNLAARSWVDAAAVCTENSNPDVMTVKPAEDRV